MASPATSLNFERDLSATLDRFKARTSRSGALHAEARGMIPGGVNRNIVNMEPHPLYFASAAGAYLRDVDGNQYLDCIGNYTSMAIGHSHPAVVEAVIEQVRRGSAWTGGSTGEIELARAVAARLPSIESIKFTSSGTEATLMACRGARAFTGRPLVAKFEGGYHGLHDYAMISMAPALADAGPAERPHAVAPTGIPDGVRDSVLVLPFNDIAACREILLGRGSAVAAIIVEPVPGVAGVLVPVPGFLEGLRALADEIGCLLIFDEVISFRLDHGGAQGLFGVRPDLTTLGKIIGGGYPIGAVGGRQDVMQVFSPSGSGPKVVLSGTFHANPVVLAAGLATLEVFSREAVTALNDTAQGFLLQLRRIVASLELPIAINAIGSLFNIHPTRQPVRTYRDSLRTNKAFLKDLYIALLNEGVMLSPRGMGVLSTAMTEDDIELLLGAFGRVLETVETHDSLASA